MGALSQEVPRQVAEALEQIRRDLAEHILSSGLPGGGMIELCIKAEGLLPVGQYLRDDPRVTFDFLSCVSVVDLGQLMDAVYHLHSLRNCLSLRLKASMDAGSLEIDSVAGLWPTANWHEREAYDLFGVVFRGHPDLRRILLDDDFEGYPMRKSYPAPRGRRPDDMLGDSIG